MNKARIEAQVIDIVNHVVEGGKIEDEYIEAKRDWPKTDKAGQLAGAANAAGGQPVIWVIGLDEDEHSVFPLDETDPADWWPQMENQFVEGVAPNLKVINVQTAHGRVVCLRFETDRAPYLAKISNGKWATSAVPWREATRTRSATRGELLSLLRATAAIPNLELVQPLAHLVGSDEVTVPPQPGTMKFSAALFIDSEPGTHILFPRHRWLVELHSATGHKLVLPNPMFLPQEQQPRRIEAGHGTRIFTPRPDTTINPYGVTSRTAGLVVLGPDLVRLSGKLTVDNEMRAILANAAWMDVVIHLPIGTSPQAARLVQRLDAFPLPDGAGNMGGLAGWRPAPEIDTDAWDPEYLIDDVQRGQAGGTHRSSGLD